MGNQYSASSGLRNMSHLNNQLSPDSTLGAVTKARMNMARAFGQGVTLNCYGGLVMVPDFRLILLLPVFLLNYNTIDISKQQADNMASIIHQRHGYENFERMSAADKTRVKSYIRSEWIYGGMLDEKMRYSPEERVGFPGNAAKLQE